MRANWRSCVAMAGLGLILASNPSFVVAADTCADAMTKSKQTRTIEAFTSCLNVCLDANNGNDVSKSVQCLPDKCMVTVTMSPQSAQRACTLGGKMNACQLPRIILDCPGPAGDSNFPNKRLRPSFLLCPVDSKSGGNFGLNRIEIGQDHQLLVNNRFVMQMADVPIPPGANLSQAPLKLADVLDQMGDAPKNKECTECHNNQLNGKPQLPNPSTVQVTDMAGNTLTANLSADFNPFGKSFTLSSQSMSSEQLTPYVIATSDANNQKNIDPTKMAKGSNGEKLKVLDLKNKGLSEICSCIDDPAKQALIKADNANPDIKTNNFPRDQKDVPRGDKTPNPNIDQALGIMSRLCKALDAYVKGPGCGTDPSPTRSCSAVAGGGKFLGPGFAVSTLRLQASGEVESDVPGLFQFTNLDGSASAYNYLTRTLIDPIAISTLTGTLAGPGQIETVTGTGVAKVNGITTSVQIKGAKMNGVITLSILNANTGAVLAGGTGEAGLSTLEFSSSLP